MSTLIEQLWERFGALLIEDLPEPVRTVGHHCVLDWWGCALAGSREPAARLVLEEIGHSTGPASVLGTDRRLDVLAAALVNGTAGHALDFDDTNTVMGGHATVPVLPAVLALAEERGATGAELLAAFVTGVEVECRLGLAIGPSHYTNGWHTTSTIGVFGAAAAASRLLDLGAEQAMHALGLAASQSSGVKANFGTMTKPFHAGHAAQRGLLAARLAARGFTADAGAFEGRQGLARAAGDGSLHLDRLTRYDDDWLILRTLFKHHAACYLTHAAIEATAQLRSRVDIEQIERATVTVHPSVLDVCAIPRPTTGLEAKFSLAATTAFALLGADTTRAETFRDDFVRSPGVRQLIARVAVETDSSLRTTQSRVRVSAPEVTHETSFDTGVPATDLAAQGERLRAKFLGLAGSTIGRETATQLAGVLERVAEVPDLGVLRT